MEINQITITYSRTQSLGNYSNVKPGCTLTATLQPGEPLAAAAIDLLETAKAIVHEEIDAALEADGSQPMFYGGPLFAARYSSTRGLVVIHPAGDDLPAAQNWRDSDRWHVLRRAVRPETARRDAEHHAAGNNMLLLDCSDGDYGRIPGPGPEPLWRVKDLEPLFRNLKITDEATWQELAALDHVNRDYLSRLYHADAERNLNQDELLALIRSGRPYSRAINAADLDDSGYEDDDF
ncbi:MAG: hypothetical protein KF770_17610 [Anaerolineae bacterium]|nr:hypothetical protein [Anaerolineae bacterium]